MAAADAEAWRDLCPEALRRHPLAFTSDLAEAEGGHACARQGEAFAAVEWRSDGTLPSGEPVSYRGVGLIEVERGGGNRARGKVGHFRTYYDSATFLPQGSKRAADERAHGRD